MKIQAVHHVAIIVSDYKKSREFYVDKLGFTVLRENFRKERRDYKLDLILDGIELEIFAPEEPDKEYQIHPGRVDSPEAYGLRHLAFRTDNIEEAAAELRAKGVETEPIRIDEFSGGKFTFFRDPDGLPLELHE